MTRTKNPLHDLHDHVEAARRFRELARHPADRKRRDVLVPLFKFFESQLPLVGFVPMDIAIQRLRDLNPLKLLSSDQLDRKESLDRLKKQVERDKKNVAAGGVPHDILKFKLAYVSSSVRPSDNSTSGRIAFWTQKRTEMAAQWGCESTHVAMGLDLTTSAFLRHLHQRLTLSQKLCFLQEFRDKDILFADLIKGDGFDHPLNGIPEFRTEVRSEVNPTLGSLFIEKAYSSWADECGTPPKRVTQPLLNLVSQLRRPTSPYNMRDALGWYGAQHDPSRSNQENILWLAACIVASEDWRDGAFQLDDALARRLRGAMRADKKFAAAAK